MNSSYTPLDMSQQVPIGGSGYHPSLPPPSSGSGPGSIHHHPPYQHHQLLPPPLQHQQPPSHHIHTNPHTQGQAQVQTHPHPHPHQLPHQHPSQSHHHQQHQAQEQQQQQNPHQNQLPHPQHPQPHPNSHHQPHQLPHPHHLSHPPPPQPPHLSQLQHQHQHQHQHQQQHIPPSASHTQPPSAGHHPRPRESSIAPTFGTLLHPEQPSGASKTLVPFSKVDEAAGRKYQLDVVQQPRRARMCGFGDKDRRPITPPPCVRLIITDIITGKEIDCNDIDHTMFVLNVDLWNEDGTREVNLVRSSTNSPSISATTPYSYPSLGGGDTAPTPYGQHVLPPGRDPSYNPPQAISFTQDYPVPSGYSQSSASYPPNGNYGPPTQYFPQHQAYRPEANVPSLPSQAISPFSRNGAPTPGGYGQDQGSLTRMAMVGGQPQGMFTRNLIGSLAASAFRLSDTLDQIGIWFVLQDLSVRTEGPFRLRFSFVNVGPRSGVSRDANGLKVNTGRAPILASCFSDVFNVYSAKKFPGVCESTPLSKTFATQGIKIPIRKDANIKGGDAEDDYGD